jgi:hypothetical protein
VSVVRFRPWAPFFPIDIICNFRWRFDHDTRGVCSGDAPGTQTYAVLTN